MSQITIYLDAATEKQARKRAKAEGVSVSKWIAKTIQGETGYLAYFHRRGFR